MDAIDIEDSLTPPDRLTLTTLDLEASPILKQILRGSVDTFSERIGPTIGTPLHAVLDAAPAEVSPRTHDLADVLARLPRVHRERARLEARRITVSFYRLGHDLSDDAGCWWQAVRHLIAKAREDATR